MIEVSVELGQTSLLSANNHVKPPLRLARFSNILSWRAVTFSPIGSVPDESYRLVFRGMIIIYSPKRLPLGCPSANGSDGGFSRAALPHQRAIPLYRISTTSSEYDSWPLHGSRCCDTRKHRNTPYARRHNTRPCAAPAGGSKTVMVHPIQVILSLATDERYKIAKAYGVHQP